MRRPLPLLLAANPARLGRRRRSGRGPGRQGAVPRPAGEQGAGPALLRPPGQAGGALGRQRLRHPCRAPGRRARRDGRVLRRFFGDAGPGGVPQERAQRSLGSGVIVDAGGLIVTNNHVIENMNEVKVALADRREFEAQIVLRDPAPPRGVEDQGADRRPRADGVRRFGGLQVGDFVIAIGNPFGVGQTVTQGIISALARTQVGSSDYQFFIQTDAGDQPGQFRRRPRRPQRRPRRHQLGDLLAVRRQPRHRLRHPRQHGPRGGRDRQGRRAHRAPAVARGAAPERHPPDIADSVGLDHPTGVLVASLQGKSPAEEAGLKRGDVILSVDNTNRSTTPRRSATAFALKGVSGETKFTSWRGTSRITRPGPRLAPAPETRRATP